MEASGYQAPSLEKGNAQATLEHLQREAPEGFLWGIHQFPMEHPPLAGVMFADLPANPLRAWGFSMGFSALPCLKNTAFCRFVPGKAIDL